MEHTLGNRLVGRLAGVLFVAAGAITVVTLPLPAPAGMNRAAVGAVGAAAIGIGGWAWRAPWDRWRRSASLWLVPIALALISFGNAQQTTIPYTDAVFFVIVFVWLGLAHPRWTSAAVAPAAAVAYTVPILLRPSAELAAAASSAAVVIPVCVLVGEAIAWVTERWRAAEEALHRRERDAVRAFKTERDLADRLRTIEDMRNGLVQAVSHEIRTPLTSILGIGLTLERRGESLPEERIRDLSGNLVQSARHLERLLGDLLDVGRLARGALEPHRRPVDVAELVRAVAAGFAGGNHPIEVSVDDFVAWVDGAKVERIVECLLSNAVRHTPAGTPVWVRAEPARDGVVLAVDDAGPGIPSELRTQIFEPFGQGRVPAHSPGLGLGLALVARFAQLHGGRAWVDDHPGGGASFRVFLPSEVRRPERERPGAAEPPAAAGDPSSRAVG